MRRNLIMKKALIITNAASMVHLFNRVNIELLQEAGYEVHIACNFVYGNTASKEMIEQYKKEWEAEGIISHQIDFLRSPFTLKSFKIYKETKKLIRESQYDIIHCHTPIVSAFTRLAARKLKKATTIIYTAHGFHFFKGAPFFNWLVYYPVEKLLAPLTDLLITINSEDYELAKKKLKVKKVIHKPGVGIDTKAIAKVFPHTYEIRSSLNIPMDSVLMVSVGEINHNKNHKMAIDALSRVKNQNIHYAIAGIGKLRDELTEYAKRLGVGDRVHFLGFRTDIFEVLKASDIFVMPSYREGLSVAMMEAMSCGLPVVASNIRGNCDLVDEEGGYLFDIHNIDELVGYIETLSDNPERRKSMGRYNEERVKECDKEIVLKKLKSVLSECEKNHCQHQLDAEGTVEVEV